MTVFSPGLQLQADYIYLSACLNLQFQSNHLLLLTLRACLPFHPPPQAGC
jgi:hypothetical protein